MNATTAGLSVVVDRMLVLLADLAQRQAHQAELLPTIYEAHARLKRLKRGLAADRYVAAFVGLSNVGKSTLLNALFGQEIASCKNCPWSAAPVEYVRGEQLRVEVAFSNTFMRWVKDCDSPEEVLAELKRYATEDGSTKDVRKVIVYLPSNLLSPHLVIADTPGFGAAHADGDVGRHDTSLTRYLRDVHQVFWVVLFEQGITARESRFYNQYLATIGQDAGTCPTCSDIVATGCEDITAKDRDNFIRTFAAQLSLNWLCFHFLSGRQAWRAKRDRDAKTLATSGIHTLESRLQAVAIRESRQRIFAVDLVDLCNGFGLWWREHRSGSAHLPRVKLGEVLHAARGITVNDHDLSEELARVLHP